MGRLGMLDIIDLSVACHIRQIVSPTTKSWLELRKFQIKQEFEAELVWASVSERLNPSSRRRGEYASLIMHS